jgi:ubiquinone/menaquinone biosynthesis C-methylase UbiE
VAETPTIASSYTFDPFARHPFYTEVNAALVGRAIGRLHAARPAGESVRVVELASGTGAVTELILDELERLGRTAQITGVEPSDEAIEIARERLGRRGVDFIQGDADTLAESSPQADAVFFCNAIHLVPDKHDAVTKITAPLRPGGLFACNSAFFDGTYAPGSERFYHLWMRRALGWLRKNHPDIRPSRTEKAMAMQQLDAAGYETLLRECGLRVVDHQEDIAHMSLRAWQDIGRYWLFIEGALPGVPIPVGADALEAGAAEAFQELELTEVPRIWLQLVSQRGEPTM